MSLKTKKRSKEFKIFWRFFLKFSSRSNCGRLHADFTCSSHAVHMQFTHSSCKPHAHITLYKDSFVRIAALWLKSLEQCRGSQKPVLLRRRTKIVTTAPVPGYTDS
jgi:hypothetical protein